MSFTGVPKVVLAGSQQTLTIDLGSSTMYLILSINADKIGVLPQSDRNIYLPSKGQTAQEFTFIAPLTPGPFRLLFDYGSSSVVGYAPLPSQVASAVVLAGVVVSSAAPTSTTYDGITPITIVLTPSGSIAYDYTVTTVSVPARRRQQATGPSWWSSSTHRV